MGKLNLGIFLLICNLCISVFASVPDKYSLGIAPQDESYYKSNVIKCKDGSKKFTREQLNDEFCDCPDGTDEPGTSACPEGRFYCQNAGHTPLTLFSSRVNDGICDCCDGSDEYHEIVKCPNTCWEAGKVAREKLKKKIQTYQQGVILRKQEIERGKEAFGKDEAELSRLKSEEKILNDLVDKLKEQKERIEKAEEEERLKKEQEEKRLREAEMKANESGKLSEEAPHDSTDGVHPEATNEDMLEVVLHAADEADQDHSDDTDDDYEVAEHLAEDHDDTHKSFRSDEDSSNNIVNKDQEDSDDTSGLSKEELGRLVASRWTREDAGHKTNEDGCTVNDEEVQHDSQNIAEEENNRGYTSETEDDSPKYDDDDDDDLEDDADDEYADHVDSERSYNPDDESKSDFSELTDSISSSWLERIKQMVHNVLSSFDFFKTPVDLSEADHVRKEYADSNSKLSKIHSRISSLTEKLKHDFVGKEKEFYSFYDHCFESKQNKYVYKVCPFKQASQVEGHSTTRLGQWKKFEESYRIMQFSKGDRCWNGPDRSLKVRLRCGLTNELADVDEPSRCEYVALLSTPALCEEDKLQELQQKLELMNTRHPQSRDEL
ncbi:glucosidase 2 subunit beta [Iris pallida]|uniref:Glucosidase 2 subunit beta n=1 Tax=Iris pallida TaxID=29817 RepID=A0AAX6HXH8_IRIPA|nr:glucosidase 2 subunit beta [Iris pallida]